MNDLKRELCEWLDQKWITSDTIGEIRRQCFMPFSTRWNAIVRKETADRENKPPRNAPVPPITP